MAHAKKKKKRFAVRFELGFGGLLAVTVVCLCIFMWMFLLGIWAGQTLLQSGGAGLKPRAATSLTAMSAGRAAKVGKNVFSSLSKWAPGAEEETVDSEAEPEYAGPTFFTMQLGAFDTEQRAMQAVAAWRARDQQSFYSRPAGKESRFRVFVGKFDTLERANEQAAAFEKQHDSKVYITLLQEREIVEP